MEQISIRSGKLLGELIKALLTTYKCNHFDQSEKNVDNSS